MLPSWAGRKCSDDDETASRSVWLHDDLPGSPAQVSVRYETAGDNNAIGTSSFSNEHNQTNAVSARTRHLTDLTKTRVVAAVIQRGDEYLICQRPAHKRHGGLWEFPGGKLEPGETTFDAATRELREELDVHVVAVGDLMLSIDDPGS